MAGVNRSLASRMRDVIRIERPVSARGFNAAGKGSWELVDEVAAEVQDVLPSRAERVDSGINMASRPARVRIRYRDDITPAMRFVMDDRIMEIISGPAVLGRREALEFMAVNYSTAGNGA